MISTFLKPALLRLRRDPKLSLAVIGVIGIAVGLNAALAGVTDRLLLRGPAHVRADVTRFFMTFRRPNGEQGRDGTFGYAAYQVLRDSARALDAVAAYSAGGTIALGRGADAELVTLGQSTASLFTVLGTSPHLGRFFVDDEDDPVKPERVAVLSFGLWSSRFGSDPAIVGGTIILGSEPFTVVGVARPGFSGASLRRTDVWIPLSVRNHARGAGWTRSWADPWVAIVARVRDGVSHEAASAEASRLYQAAYEGGNRVMAGGLFALASLRHRENGLEQPEAPIARWLASLGIVFLVVACANIVNLLFAQMMRRSREVAIRTALGADRLRLTVMLTTEAGLLGFGGLLVGLWLAVLIGRVVRQLLLPGLDWATTSVVEWSTFFVAVSIVFAVAAVMGGAQAVLARRAAPLRELRGGMRDLSRRMSRIRTGLIVLQSTMSMVLMLAAASFVRSLARVENADLGIDTAGTQVISFRYAALPANQPPDERESASRRQMQLFSLALERLRSIPGVERSAMTRGLPFRYGYSGRLRVPGWDSLPVPYTEGRPSVDVFAAGDGYFEAVGTTVLRGRSFGASDGAGMEPVAIVNGYMAATLWPGQDPIGKCIYPGVMAQEDPCARIVGVVESARSFAIRENPVLAYYVPLGQDGGLSASAAGTFLVARFRPGWERKVRAAVREELALLDPGISYVDIRSLSETIDPQIRPWRLGASMFTIMGSASIAMAAFGIFSVLSYLVQARRGELAVRTALGATRGRIVYLVIRRNALWTLSGALMGSAVAWVAAPYFDPLLFNVSLRDLRVITSLAAALVVVGTIAGLAPALTASRVDPREALGAA